MAILYAVHLKCGQAPSLCFFFFVCFSPCVMSFCLELKLVKCMDTVLMPRVTQSAKKKKKKWTK